MRIEFSIPEQKLWSHGVYKTCEGCLSRVIGRLMEDPEWYINRLRENGDYRGYSVAHFVAAEAEALHGDAGHEVMHGPPTG